MLGKLLGYSVYLVIAIISCFITLRMLYPLAIKIRLVDSPDERKNHEGQIPLIGGIAMFVGFIVTILLYESDCSMECGILIPASIIVFVGALDDHRDISVHARFFLQIISVLLMISLSNVVLNDLGDILGYGNIKLAGWAIPITVIAAVGVMNALNMIDGVDGLAGLTALICFISVLVLHYINGQVSIKPLIFIGVLIPFLWRNLSKVKKIFMGDAGSMFIGFGIVWVLLESSQGDSAVMTPVTALWIFALPLIDTVVIMMRRISKGNSPFLADREHLHHLFLRAGFSYRETLLILTFVAILFSLVGILGYVYSVSEWLMFASFMVVFFIYLLGMRHAWKLLCFIRQNFRTNALKAK